MHAFVRARIDDFGNVDAEIANRTAGDDHAKRTDSSASPARKVVEIERHPRRKVDDLGRHRRNTVPWILAEKRHPDLCEDARVGKTAELANDGKRALHFVARRIDAE